MIKIVVDNVQHSVKPGKNLLETCLTLGLDLPYFCWHPALGSVGACRQCAIKLFKDEKDTKGRLVMSCMEPVAENQRISLVDPEAVAFRSGVIEWLMTNHPHDCAICDEGGSCHLQDMTVMTGHNYRRFAFKKRTHTNQDLGPFINHEMNRCIQCYRCTRFYKDYAGGEDLDVFASKSHVYFGRHEPGTLESEFSGNLSEVCPTGVFTDKTLKQHYTRKWDLTMAPSICQHCSLGCNIIAGERYGGLRMIANRYHGEINGYFLCDRGRFGYEFVNAADRPKEPMHMGKPVSPEDALTQIAATLKSGNVIGIGSPRASLQSNFALQTLVGKGNFFHGISKSEHRLAALALSILREGPAPTAAMKETEKADAVFVLGEDLTNSAPMLALALRQSVQRQPMEDVHKISVPEWNDAAAREVIQDKKGPLFIATTSGTKLDSIATKTHRAAPQDLARLGFAVANLIDSTAPGVKDLDADEKAIAAAIAKELMSAKQPLVVSGTSSQSEAVMQAAAQVAWALHRRNSQTRIVLTLPECNSFGLSLMEGRPLEDAITNSKADTVVILEGNLYSHVSSGFVDEFLAKCKTVIVVDHTAHATLTRAHWVLPAGSFAESDGIVINNEGRAQRYFQVYESAAVKESWRWLINVGDAMGNSSMSWNNFDEVTTALVQSANVFSGIENVSPASSARMPDGQRVARQPHRYSGRTAMHAHHKVSEAKPPEDPDSGMSYTMEGTRALPPSSMIPYFWTPGWNSVQSVNKYQEEVGAALRGGDPGVRLNGHKGGAPSLFKGVPEKFKQGENKLWTVPIHHIFGSEELSSRAPAVAQRVPKPYVLLSKKDAGRLGLDGKQEVGFIINGITTHLPIAWSESLAAGLMGLPMGLPNMPHTEMPAWATIMK